MPARKRQAPETPDATKRRRSPRISSSGKRSQYFEGDSDDDQELDEDDRRVSRKYKSSGNTSRERSNAKKAKVAHDEADDDDNTYAVGDSNSEEAQPKDEERDDSDDWNEDGNPREKIIPHVRMRDTGGIDYEDDKLHKNTLLFLKDLKANNKRSWLKGNDDEYRRSLKDWNTYVETLTHKIMSVDPTIPELPVKDVIFRIYRDIRFTKDPTPYKAHYSAAWSRTGRKGPYACYYVHAEPGSCFVGGGLWHPDSGHLEKLRASIDERPRRWRRVLMDEAFRGTFLPKSKRGDEKSVLKAFADSNKENALKTKPKGFIAEHRDIGLLKLRNFTVGKKIADNVLTAANGQEQITETIRAMVGFVTFLNDVVMPDLNLDDDSSSNEDDEE